MRDAPLMAKLAAKHVKDTSRTLLMSSDALRALTTAKEFANAIGFNETDILQNEDLYLADEFDTMDEIKTVPDNYDTLFVFGHNPGFTYLLNRLCNLNIDNVPTCGVACVQFAIDKWMDVSFGKGELIFFEYPKKYYKEPLSE
jgi:phosphohistidine phosphatase